MRMPVWAASAVLLAVVGLAEAGPPPPDGTTRSPRRRLAGWPPPHDCTANAPWCHPLAIQGDAAHVIPGFGPGPFRGFADPSLRRDPAGGRLWLGYSWPHLEVLPPAVPGGEPRTSAVVDIHLAHSDDGGLTWWFDGPLWTSAAEDDAGGSGQRGFSSHEVVTLLPLPATLGGGWAAARLRYFVPEGGRLLGRRSDSIHFRVARAATPAELATAPETRLGGFLTATGWDLDVRLSALAPELVDCAIWNEPALFAEGGTLYLVAGCMVFDPATGTPLPERDRVEVFATDAVGDVRGWTWRYAGVLAGHAEAAALGGESLVQTDIVRARDGTLLALVTPNRWDAALAADIHAGCRAVEIVSMDPPALRGNAAGMPVLRLSITASDLAEYGPAACGYDPASATGVLFTRRVFDLEAPEMVWSLHRTGLHP